MINGDEGGLFDLGRIKALEVPRCLGAPPPCTAVPPSHGLQTLMILKIYPSQQASRAVPEPSR